MRLFLALAAGIGVARSGEPSGLANALITNAPPLVLATATGTNSMPAAPLPSKKADQPLLLLDDSPADSAAAAVGGADNSRCLVCHVNFALEKLSVTHSKTNVGCANCHGASDAHIADESWASGGNGTAPDTMYPRTKISRACLECHKVEKVFKLEPHKADDLWLMAYDLKVCTDCHGQHRMVTRKCKWKQAP